jgi:hypothetical protein
MTNSQQSSTVPRDLGMTTETALVLLGATTFDIYLNDVAYWRNVPANVWRYTIGGYQVIKKWLSYRERALLGRDLTGNGDGSSVHGCNGCGRAHGPAGLCEIPGVWADREGRSR